MHAVPLLFRATDGFNNGSAILIGWKSRKWLLTAAHLPLMLHQPHKRWEEWPEHALIPGAPQPLFNQTPRSPKFLYLDCGNHIADIMIIPLDQSIVCAPPLSDFVTFELEFTAVTPAIGSRIAAYGFVKDGTNLSNEQQVSGTVAVVTPETVRVTAIPPPGFSGGPLVQANGKLAGMTIGSDEGLGTAVSCRAIIHTLEQHAP